jgi:hypothetical protein
VALRVFGAQDDDADGDQDEGEEGADVGHLGERADVEEAGGDGDEDAGDPGGEGRRAEARMDAAEASGSRRSRDMANQMRAWPYWPTRMDEIMPVMAPMRTKSRT